MHSHYGPLRPKAMPVLSAAFIIVGLAGVLIDRPAAQQVRRSTSLTASGGDLLAALPRVDAMLRDGTLDIGAMQEDTMIDGRVHERLNQKYGGLPVFGAQVIRQLAGGSVVSLSGSVYDGIAVSTTAALAADQAADRARLAAGTGAAVSKAPVLGVLPRADGSYVLAYKLETRNLWALHVWYVNGNTGLIERDYSNVQTQGVIGTGTGVLGDPKKMSVVSLAGTFRTDDRLRPARNLTFDFRGSFARLDSFFFNGTLFTSDFATDSDNVWSDGAIVDAHTYQGWTYDYYFRRFGRRSLDDRNVEVVSIVHPLARADFLRYPPEIRNVFINNAFYDPDFNLMVYGDGDGRNFDYFAGALDVVGHELSHGVTNFTSHLEYFDESGALNEAFSDIMGASIEFFYQTMGAGPGRADWIIGEDITRAFPGYVRSLNNPAAIDDPDHYTLRRYIGTERDNGGVHTNCTIATHAFYLAIAGGTNRVSGIQVAGVGFNNRERIERIFYRGFAFHLAPNARFSDARAATLQAATEIFGAGSNERVQVAQAWTAVGVN